LLVWSVDGAEISRLTGVAAAGEGPHRAAPMRIVVNLAVGGTFAGHRILGPTSSWWGDAMVPASFPRLDWTSASFEVSDVRFTPLDRAVLGER
jgi:beta-glucanase (GH16 family)